MRINLRKIFSEGERAVGMEEMCENGFGVIETTDSGHLKITCSIPVVSAFHRKCLHCLSMLGYAVPFGMGVTERTVQFYSSSVIFVAGDSVHSVFPLNKPP